MSEGDPIECWHPIGEFRSARGRLHVVEAGACPFAIERVFFIADVPLGSVRGRHAHHTTEELLMAAAGGCRVLLDDGHHVEEFDLSPGAAALYVPRLTWIELTDFLPGTVLVVAASNAYDPAGYINSYPELLAARRRFSPFSDLVQEEAIASMVG